MREAKDLTRPVFLEGKRIYLSPLDISLSEGRIGAFSITIVSSIGFYINIYITYIL